MSNEMIQSVNFWTVVLAGLGLCGVAVVFVYVLNLAMDEMESMFRGKK